MTGQLVELDSVTIGGSEAAAACGVDPHRSRVELWAEKRGHVRRLPTEAMRVGRLLLPAVEQLVRHEGYETLPAPAEGFRHPERRWQVGHPDGFVVVDGDRGVLELQTRGTGWTDDTAALGPDVLKIQHYLDVTGLPAGLLAVLHGGHGGLQLDLTVVHRDDGLIALLVSYEAEFLELVRRETPPAPDGSSSAAATLRTLFPGMAGEQVRATAELWRRHVLPARELAATIRAAELELERHRQAIQLHMGDAAELLSANDELVARWTPYTRTAVDVKRLRAERPDVAAAYATETPSRRFSLD